MQKEEIYKKFEELDKVAALGGGVVRIDKQHEAGRMTCLLYTSDAADDQ